MQGNKENMNISNWNNCNNNSNMREGNGDRYINNPKGTQNVGKVNNSLGVFLTTEAESDSCINLQENDIYENDATSAHCLEQESSVGIYLTTEGANEIEPPMVVNDDDVYVNESPIINTLEMDANPSGIYPTTIPEKETNGIYVNESPNSCLSQQQENEALGVYLTNLPDDPKQANGITDDHDINMNESTNSSLPQRHTDEAGAYMAMTSEDVRKAKVAKIPNMSDPYMAMGDLTNTKPSLPDTDGLGIYLTNPDDNPEDMKTNVRYLDNPTNAHNSTNVFATEPKRGYVLDPKRETYIDIIGSEEYEAMVNERKLHSNTLEESACSDEATAGYCENGYLLPVEERERRNNGRTSDAEIRYVPDPTNGTPQPLATNVYHTIDLPPDEQLTHPKVLVQTTHLLSQSEGSAPQNSTDGQEELYSHLDEVAMERPVTPMMVQQKGKGGMKYWQIVCFVIAACVLCVGLVGLVVWAALEGQAPKPTQSMLLNGTGMTAAVTTHRIEVYFCDPTAFTGVGEFDHTEMIQSGKMALFLCPEGFVAVDNLPERYIYPVCQNGDWKPIPQCARITTTTRRPTTVPAQYCRLQNTDSVKFHLVESNAFLRVGSDPTRKVTFRCKEGYELVDERKAYTYCSNGALSPAPNCTEKHYDYDY